MSADGAAHVVLMGLMGAGKSTVGRLVADALGRPLVDVDLVIRERTGLTVAELWAQGGEAAYRPIERGVAVAALTGAGPDVLALPGGAIADPSVREALAAPGVYAVWLQLDPAVLAVRVRGSDHRPLVGDDPLSVLERQAAERSAAFRAAADLVLVVGDRSPDDLAAAVLAAVRSA